MKKQLIIAILLGVLACSNTNEENKTISSDDSVKTDFWVSESYLNCIKKTLPCECINLVDAEFCLLVQHHENQVIDIYENGGETSRIVLKMVDSNTYSAYINPNEHSFFDINVNTDTLVLEQSGKHYKYINCSKMLTYMPNENMLARLNTIILLNNYDTLRRLGINEHMQFNCNRELGYLNLLSTTEKCDSALIFEQTNTEINIYNFLNSCDSKSVPHEILKKELYQLQLN